MIHLSGHERSGVRDVRCANSRAAPTLKHRLDDVIGPTVIAPVITCITSDLCVSAPGTERKQHVRALMTGADNLNLRRRKHCSIVPNGNESGYGTMADLITNSLSEPPQLLTPPVHAPLFSSTPPPLPRRPATTAKLLPNCPANIPDKVLPNR